jgi:hypothetical protein
MKNYTKKEVNILGTVRYYNDNNLYHRTDGPAVDFGDYKFWYINGKSHRIAGPAIVRPDSGIWHLLGKRYKKIQHNILVLFSILESRRIDLTPKEDGL